jgi:hypothetical protein
MKTLEKVKYSVDDYSDPSKSLDPIGPSGRRDIFRKADKMILQAQIQAGLARCIHQPVIAVKVMFVTPFSILSGGF